MTRHFGHRRSVWGMCPRCRVGRHRTAQEEGKGANGTHGTYGATGGGKQERERKRQSNRKYFLQRRGRGTGGDRARTDVRIAHQECPGGEDRTTHVQDPNGDQQVQYLNDTRHRHRMQARRYRRHAAHVILQSLSRFFFGFPKTMGLYRAT